MGCLEQPIVSHRASGVLMRATIALMLCGLMLSGCNNSCQMLCVRIAKVAETDCGIPVPDEDIATCIDRQAGAASRDDRATCRSSNSLADIRAEWSCEDMAYFLGVVRADGGEDGA